MDSLKKMKSLMFAGLMATSFAAHADLLNLTTDVSGVINGKVGSATFTSNLEKPTGTGVIGSFVELIGTKGVKQGYNTTANDTYDNGSSDQFNHAIRVGNVGFIDLGGGNEVMRFLLDINQTNVKDELTNWLTLDEVQVYLSPTANAFIDPALANFQTLSLGTLLYQMDNDPTDNTVLMDYNINEGSGSGDIYMDISKDLFDAAFDKLGVGAAADRNNYFIYLYSRVGGDSVTVDGVTAKYPNNDGFEEWAAITGTGFTDDDCPKGSTDPDCVTNPNETPEPATLAILGAGLLGMAIARRRGRIG